MGYFSLCAACRRQYSAENLVVLQSWSTCSASSTELYLYLNSVHCQGYLYEAVDHFQILFHGKYGTDCKYWKSRSLFYNSLLKYQYSVQDKMILKTGIESVPNFIRIGFLKEEAIRISDRTKTYCLGNRVKLSHYKHIFHNKQKNIFFF